MNKSDARLVQILPSPRQLAFQQLEFYAFIHFTVNTFTDLEWGEGTEPEAIFDPKLLDARQWVDAIKSAGMRGLILTCKHHDGFCLWPSKYTEHSVKNSPFRGGKGDVVREVADACAGAGLKFGVYLSPWDRNSALYGQGKAYDDYFIAQLTELLTEYGPIFDVWFDGACGEGPNGKRQYYDWERYYATIRRLQPDACINVCGPDVRWCGNEAGDTRPAEWSVVPERVRNTEKIASESQQADDDSFRKRKLKASDRDLGSRDMLEGEERLIWYPAEVNTSIRPGWFYHAREDDAVRSLDELMHVYLGSVGGNGTFLLNIPPTPDGLLHANDVRRLHEIGDTLRDWFRDNLLTRADASLTADACAPGFEPEKALSDGYDGCFKTEDGVTGATLVMRWDEPVAFRHVVLKEDLRYSQRIERYAIDVMENGEWECRHEGSVVGYKRIVPLEARAQAVRVRILDSRVSPTLAFVGVYA
jgi:alpha-L-fucosidase